MEFEKVTIKCNIENHICLYPSTEMSVAVMSNQ